MLSVDVCCMFRRVLGLSSSMSMNNLTKEGMTRMQGLLVFSHCFYKFCKVVLLTCLRMAQVQAETCSTHVNVTI